MTVRKKTLLVVFFTAIGANVAGMISAQEQIDYLRQIKPILAETLLCVSRCAKQEAGLRLDTAALAIRGAKTGR